ncbi:VOC family protein [Aliiroseovarius sp. S1339]|uniref:VOC family protein n=1 Tax=Aliiroseovarius sp. S1339 TaxID=2936990 RepID=UPI0020BE33CA|nr:VOC family protein [Aliiroseovarius sp. S1339]MCK8463797.1 VOC family protein [Aliiroseovarius sp. S1339]
MNTIQYYPLIQVQDVGATAAFYSQHFGFKAMFESDWYVHLQSEENDAINLAILRYDHDTIPHEGRGKTKGVILTFEVADIDGEHERLHKAGVSVAQELRDEPHGQRHAIYRDPNGVLVDLVTPIAPSQEFASGYDPSALPQ